MELPRILAKGFKGGFSRRRVSFPLDLALVFGIVFAAEFADKTQLALLAMSARGKGLQIWMGASLAFLILTFAAAIAGELLQSWIPGWVVTLLAGLLFLVFGLKGLLGSDEDEEEMSTGRVGFLPAFSLMLVAELGDKTQLTVAALAAESGAFWATAIGGTLALSASAALAVLAGGWIGRKVRKELVERVASWGFILVGLLILVFGLLL